MDLTLDTRRVGAYSVVEVAGEIDVYTASRLRQHLTDLVVAGDRHIVIDLEKVDFLDSTGLGVLVGGLKKARAREGSLALVCTREPLLKIFRITQLSKVFGIYPSLDDAVAAGAAE